MTQATNTPKRNVFIATVVSASNACVLMFVFMVNGSPLASSERGDATKQGTRTSPQEKRIKSYIDGVRNEDLDELIGNLGTPEFSLHVAGMRSQEPSPQLTFESCLGNRRLAVIYAKLKQKSESEAASISESIFRGKLERLKADWRRAFNAYEENGRRKEPLPINRNYFAVSAALFLVAAFCDSEALVECSEEWVAFGERAIARLKANENLSILRNEVEQRANPENLFRANLFLWHLSEHQATGAIDSILKDLAEQGLTRRKLSYREIPFVAWDCYANASNFAHHHLNVPVDADKVMRTFKVCRRWLDGGVASEEGQERVVNSLREKYLPILRTGDGLLRR